MTVEGDIEELPQGIIPEVTEFIKETRLRLDSPQGAKFSVTPYGHAAGVLAEALKLNAEVKDTSEQQKQKLREFALDLIGKYGKEIIVFLRKDLRLTLSDEDLGF